MRRLPVDWRTRCCGLCAKRWTGSPSCRSQRWTVRTPRPRYVAMAFQESSRSSGVQLDPDREGGLRFSIVVMAARGEGSNRDMKGAPKRATRPVTCDVARARSGLSASLLHEISSSDPRPKRGRAGAEWMSFLGGLTCAENHADSRLGVRRHHRRLEDVERPLDPGRVADRASHDRRAGSLGCWRSLRGWPALVARDCGPRTWMGGGPCRAHQHLMTDASQSP